MPKVEPKADDRAGYAHRVRAPTVSRAPVRVSMDARGLRAVGRMPTLSNVPCGRTG